MPWMLVTQSGTKSWVNWGMSRLCQGTFPSGQCSLLGSFLVAAQQWWVGQWERLFCTAEYSPAAYKPEVSTHASLQASERRYCSSKTHSSQTKLQQEGLVQDQWWVWAEEGAWPKETWLWHLGLKCLTPRLGRWKWWMAIEPGKDRAEGEEPWLLSGWAHALHANGCRFNPQHHQAGVGEGPSESRCQYWAS